MRFSLQTSPAERQSPQFTGTKRLGRWQGWKENEFQAAEGLE